MRPRGDKPLIEAIYFSRPDLHHLHFLSADHKHGGHLFQCQASDLRVQIPWVRRPPRGGISAMQGFQPTHQLPYPGFLHSFARNFSRSLSRDAIQPLPPEFLEAAPLAPSRKAGETARFWKTRCPPDLPCDKLGRWIRSPP